MKAVPRISVRVLKYFFNGRYRLAAMTKRSNTFSRVVEKMLFDGDDMIVVPKDSVVKRNVDINIDIEDAGESTVLPSDVVKRLISEADDIFIMDFCLCRRSNKCDDYPIDHGCVFMGKGIHKIPPEFGHVATKEEAKEYIDECGKLGLVHIIGRNKLDSIWLSTGNKKDLMTICNCCPCCCLWNVTRNISDDIGGLFKRMDGVSVELDQSKCIGCGSCEEICFTKAVKIEDGVFHIDQKLCRGCGRCAESCPSDAISLTFNDSKIDAEVERIGNLVQLSDKSV